MKKVITFCLLCLVFASCTTPWSPKPTSEFYENDKFYYNIDLKIVAINGDCSFTNDKYHKPQLCNTVLLSTVNDIHPTLYMEVNTCKKSPKIHIDTEWLYNHRPGDIVHFEYLCKNNFFEIKERN